MSGPPLSYLELLHRIHGEMRPRNYLEIGVGMGHSFNLATCPAVGVDPDRQCPELANPQATFFEMTSDDFFASRHPADLFPNGIDLAFIDGMHRFEFALRDFMHIERLSHKDSIVAIHDCYPFNNEMAERERLTELWCGDVWKLLPIFSRYRPDLQVRVFNSPPVGLVLVSRLSRGNAVFRKHYQEIIKKFEPLSLRDYGLARLRKAFPAEEGRDSKLHYRLAGSVS